MLRNGQVKLPAQLFVSSTRSENIHLLRHHGFNVWRVSSTAHTLRTLAYKPEHRLGPRSRVINNQIVCSLIRTRLISSTNSLQKKGRGRLFHFFYRFFAYTGGFILVSGGLILAFFAYDATTYREDLSYTDIPVSEKALEPRRGGPKNLPIAEVLVDDDDPEMARQKHKPKLVVLGSGWGSVALLKTLNPENYHVTVVSPVNYFLFTPMLPSATVGTLELRSLIEPIRRIVQRVRGHFLRAEAVEVEMSDRLLEVAQEDASGQKRHFYLPYDKLVIGVGV